MKHCVISGLLSVLCIGCGGSDGPGVETAPVSGVVMLDGKPMPSPLVTFYPAQGPTGIGIGDSSGAFTVMTNGQSGAPVGKCKVTVVPGSTEGSEMQETNGDEAAMTEQSPVDAKFASAATTDLQINVPAEGLPSLTLEVTSSK